MALGGDGIVPGAPCHGVWAPRRGPRIRGPRAGFPGPSVAPFRMKAFLIFLLGAVVGVLGYQYYQRTRHPTVAQRAGDVADATRDKAGDIKDTVVEKSKAAGEKLDDARIIAAIKGKYVVEKDLPTLAISVSCHDGQVTLSGVLDSEAQIVRAVKLARETSGVSSVDSQLKVRN